MHWIFSYFLVNLKQLIFLKISWLFMKLCTAVNNFCLYVTDFIKKSVLKLNYNTLTQPEVSCTVFIMRVHLSVSLLENCFCYYGKLALKQLILQIRLF